MHDRTQDRKVILVRAAPQMKSARTTQFAIATISFLFRAGSRRTVHERSVLCDLNRQPPGAAVICGNPFTLGEHHE